MGINVRIQNFPTVRKTVKAEKKEEPKNEVICKGCPYQQTERYCFPCMKKILGEKRKGTGKKIVFKQEEKRDG